MVIGSLGFSPLTWLLPPDPEFRSEKTGWALDEAPILDCVNIFPLYREGKSSCQSADLETTGDFWVPGRAQSNHRVLTLEEGQEGRSQGDGVTPEWPLPAWTMEGRRD